MAGFFAFWRNLRVDRADRTRRTREFSSSGGDDVPVAAVSLGYGGFAVLAATDGGKALSVLRLNIDGGEWGIAHAAAPAGANLATADKPLHRGRLIRLAAGDLAGGWRMSDGGCFFGRWDLGKLTTAAGAAPQASNAVAWAAKAEIGGAQDRCADLAGLIERPGGGPSELIALARITEGPESATGLLHIDASSGAEHGWRPLGPGLVGGDLATSGSELLVALRDSAGQVLFETRTARGWLLGRLRVQLPAAVDVTAFGGGRLFALKDQGGFGLVLAGDTSTGLFALEADQAGAQNDNLNIAGLVQRIAADGTSKDAAIKVPIGGAATTLRVTTVRSLATTGTGGVVACSDAVATGGLKDHDSVFVARFAQIDKGPVWIAEDKQDDSKSRRCVALVMLKPTRGYAVGTASDGGLALFELLAKGTQAAPDVWLKPVVLPASATLALQPRSMAERADGRLIVVGERKSSATGQLEVASFDPGKGQLTLSSVDVQKGLTGSALASSGVVGIAVVAVDAGVVVLSAYTAGGSVVAGLTRIDSKGAVIVTRQMTKAHVPGWVKMSQDFGADHLSIWPVGLTTRRHGGVISVLSLAATIEAGSTKGPLQRSWLVKTDDALNAQIVGTPGSVVGPPGAGNEPKNPYPRAVTEFADGSIGLAVVARGKPAAQRLPRSTL